MWMLVLALPMIYLIFACLNVLPKLSQRVSPHIGLLLLVPVGLALISLTQLMAFTLFMVTAGSLAIYYFIRGAAVLGIDASYRTYSRDHNMSLSPLYRFTAYAIAFAEPLAMFALFVLAFATGYPGPVLSGKGMLDIMLFVTGILSVGFIVAYVYLIAIHGNRARIARRSQIQKGTAVRPKSNVPTPPNPAPKRR